MSTLLLVRHGQAHFGLRTYDRLSPEGRLQAAGLGRVLAEQGLRVDRVLSGALRRQRETAELVAAATRAPDHVIDARWNEYEHLPLIARVHPGLGRHWRLAAALAPAADRRARLQAILDDALSDWLDEKPSRSAREDGVPSFADFAHDRQHALDDAAQRPGTTIVVSSAGAIAAAILPLLGASPAAWLRLQRVIGNASVTRVVRGRRGLSLVSFNEQGHRFPTR